MYKKNILLLVGAFTIMFTGYSQIKYGAAFGINHSRFTEKSEATNGAYVSTDNLAIKLGVYSEIPLLEKILFTPKILYSQMGDRNTNFSEDSNLLNVDTIDYKLDYISIPLNIRFFNKLYIALGPQIGFLISDKAESIVLEEKAKTIDLGGNFEIGYAIKDFRFGLNMYQGFSNIFEISEIRNLVYSLNVSYIIGKK
jgi:hypothetical protein